MSDTNNRDDELNNLLGFLYGENSYNGVWFRSTPEGANGAYWWRKELRRLIKKEREVIRKEYVAQVKVLEQQVTALKDKQEKE